MRTVALARLLLAALGLVGCQGKAEKADKLLAQYNADYPAYARECLDPVTSESARMLTGEKLTAEQSAALEAKKKERDARCKPQADRLAQIQREILAAQQ
jgi:hypothetical protein